MPKVLTETRDRALVVTINRPDVRNCVVGCLFARRACRRQHHSLIHGTPVVEPVENRPL